MQVYTDTRSKGNSFRRWRSAGPPSEKDGPAGAQGLSFVWIDEHIDAFSDWCLYEKNHRPRTVRANINFLRQFCRWGAPRYADITPEIIRRFKKDMMLRGLGSSSVRNALCAVRIFFEFTRATLDHTTNPAAKITNPAFDEPARPVFPYEHAEQVIRAAAWRPRQEHFFNLRDQAMIATFIYTGLRRESVQALNLEDVDLPNGTLNARVLKGKTKRLLLPICRAYQKWLLPYLEARSEIMAERDKFGPDPLIINVFQRRISY